MTLIEKLSLLNLDKKEEVKARQKFLATFSLVSENELKERLEFLRSKNILITKVKEIKVLAIPVEELAKKYTILSEIHETELYVSEPSALLLNVIDIYKKIKYCIQNNIEYKWETEKNTYRYADFLKSEIKWKEFLSQREKSNKVSEEIPSLGEDLVTLEPFNDAPVKEEASNNLFQEFTSPLDFKFEDANTEDNLVSFSEIKTPQIEEPIKLDPSFSSVANDEVKPASFGNLDDIQSQLDKLDELKSSLSDSQDIYFGDSYNGDSLGFNDISPEFFDTESYGRGGRAA